MNKDLCDEVDQSEEFELGEWQLHAPFPETGVWSSIYNWFLLGVTLLLLGAVIIGLAFNFWYILKDSTGWDIFTVSLIYIGIPILAVLFFTVVSKLKNRKKPTKYAEASMSNELLSTPEHPEDGIHFYEHGLLIRHDAFDENENFLNFTYWLEHASIRSIQLKKGKLLIGLKHSNDALTYPVIPATAETLVRHWNQLQKESTDTAAVIDREFEIKCLPILPSILCLGLVTSTLCIGFSFLIETPSWLPKTFTTIPLLLISVILPLTLMLLTSSVIYLLYAGTTLQKVEVSADGVVLQCTKANEELQLIDWEMIEQIKYRRWGIDLTYHSKEEKVKLRLAPVFQHQAEELISLHHAIKMKNT